jgi:hypothetical protein
VALKIEVDGEQLEVTFAHTTDFAGAVTDCFILRVRGDGKKIVARGTAYCHAADRFVKETGRKIALTRALSSARRVDPWTWDKKKRQQVWFKYFGRMKKHECD